MFWNNTIRRRVMKTLNDRIDQSQKNYDEQCKTFDADLEDQILNLRAQNEASKANAASECVASVLGPLNA